MQWRVVCLQKVRFTRTRNSGKYGVDWFFYGDESHVSSEGYVPYGWQFPDEEVAVYVEKGYKTNIFGMINRSNVCHWKTTEQNINSEFVINFLEDLSFKIQKKTVVALDNASVHRSKLLKQNIENWEKKRVIYLLSATLFSTSEHCGNLMAKIENRVAISWRLSWKRYFILLRKQMYGKCRKTSKHPFLAI